MNLCKGCMEQYDSELKICPYCGYEADTPPESTLHMKPGVLLNDRYIIGKVLGYGGFGVTYLAYDGVLQIKTAIKEYLPSEFATRVVGQNNVTVYGGKKKEQFYEGMSKFIAEAKNLARFHSAEGIVKIFNTFEANNTAYIVMELLEGETLSQYIEREKKIPEDKAVEMIIPIVKSLITVHKEGIIHRDIAPDNIFVTKKGEVKLIDFGAARFATTSHSRSLTVIIKPGYSPEEQYRSRGDQGPHTDVYAVAATMYKMITGQTPPDALERRAYFEKKGKDKLLPISKYAKNIDLNLEAAIMNALNVRIEDRTPNMEAFLDELTSNKNVKRRSGKIKKYDPLHWPMWAKASVSAGVLAGVVLIVLAVTGVIIPGSNIPMAEEIPEGQTSVPNVIGHELSSGKERLSDYDLQMRISQKVSSVNVPDDYILTQSINGGAVVPVNSFVTVTVSSQIKQLVPDTCGLELETARSELEALGFVVLVESRYDSVVAEGCIIEQSVEAETELPEGSKITLAVSKGKDPEIKQEIKEIILPNFSGMTYSQAVKTAGELGITVKIKERKYSKSYEKNEIISQTPKAESKVKTGQTVEFVVSLGYSMVTVPDVTMLSEEKAITILESRGLSVSVEYKDDDTYEKGLVMSQTPEKDSEAEPESKVTIVVSSGSPKFKMPDVVGQQSGSASDTLIGKGLLVELRYEQNDSKSEGEVLAQSVKSGADVKRGDTVVLTVCTHSSVVAVPNVVGKTQSDAKKELSDKGFVVYVVEVSSDSVAKGKVISQTPSGGSSLKKGDTVTINVSSGKSNSISSSTTASSVSGTTQNSGSSAAAASSSASSASASSKASGQTSSRASSSKSGSSSVKPESVSAPVEVTSVKISSTEEELTINRTLKLTASVVPSNAHSRDITWSSSNTSVATVDSTGLVTARGAGTANITAESDNGKKAVCKVKVTIPVESITLSETVINLYVTETKQLTATVSPSNATDKTITWSSSDNSVVKVGSNGTLKPVAYGYAEITAKSSSGVTAVCMVSVSDNIDVSSEESLVDKGSCGDDVSWELSRDGELRIYGSGDIYDYTGTDSSCDTPWYQYRNDITTVMIDWGISKIGDYAFNNCNNVIAVYLPDTVDMIGQSAFRNCTSLEMITIPSSVSLMNSYAFYGCSSLTDITLSDSLMVIEFYTFSGCTSLRSITIPSQIGAILSNAFANCPLLGEIRFQGDKPLQMTALTNASFKDVEANVYYPAGNGTWDDIENTWNGGGTMTFIPE